MVFLEPRSKQVKKGGQVRITRTAKKQAPKKTTPKAETTSSQPVSRPPPKTITASAPFFQVGGKKIPVSQATPAQRAVAIRASAERVAQQRAVTSQVSAREAGLNISASKPFIQTTTGQRVSVPAATGFAVETGSSQKQAAEQIVQQRVEQQQQIQTQMSQEEEARRLAQAAARRQRPTFTPETFERRGREQSVQPQPVRVVPVKTRAAPKRIPGAFLPATVGFLQRDPLSDIQKAERVVGGVAAKVSKKTGFPSPIPKPFIEARERLSKKVGDIAFITPGAAEKTVSGLGQRTEQEFFKLGAATERRLIKARLGEEITGRLTTGRGAAVISRVAKGAVVALPALPLILSKAAERPSSVIGLGVETTEAFVQDPVGVGSELAGASLILGGLGRVRARVPASAESLIASEAAVAQRFVVPKRVSLGVAKKGAPSDILALEQTLKSVEQKGGRVEFFGSIPAKAQIRGRIGKLIQPGDIDVATEFVGFAEKGFTRRTGKTFKQAGFDVKDIKLLQQFPKKQAPITEPGGKEITRLSEETFRRVASIEQTRAGLPDVARRFGKDPVRLLIQETELIRLQKQKPLPVFARAGEARVAILENLVRGQAKTFLEELPRRKEQALLQAGAPSRRALVESSFAESEQFFKTFLKKTKDRPLPALREVINPFAKPKRPTPSPRIKQPSRIFREVGEPTVSEISRLPSSLRTPPPSVLPSLRPSRLPSGLSSTLTSGLPSIAPSRVPTSRLPSIAPSIVPTRIPKAPSTFLPSIKETPTSLAPPSRAPQLTSLGLPSRPPQLTTLLPSSRVPAIPSTFFPPSRQPSSLPPMFPPSKLPRVFAAKRDGGLRLERGFQAFVKKRGKFVSVGGALPKAQAFALGKKIVFETPSQTFRILPTRQLVRGRGKGFISLEGLRRPRGKTKLPRGSFVELSKLAIKEPGELRGITAKGIAARRAGKGKKKKSRSSKLRPMSRLPQLKLRGII